MSKSVDDILADMVHLRRNPQRPSDRIPEVLSLIQEIWESDRTEDLRFFQLLYAIFGDGDHYNMEDSEVVKVLSNYLKEQSS